jgi:hypothetical protein
MNANATDPEYMDTRAAPLCCEGPPIPAGTPLRWSPDDRRVFGIVDATTIAVWDARTGERRQELPMN